MHPLSLDELLAARAAAGRPYVEVLAVPALSAGVYELAAGARDEQTPHTEDEVYVVLRGKAMLTIGPDTFAVSPGAMVYVPAAVEHRFHDITDDLALLVIFAPPEGSVTTLPPD